MPTLTQEELEMRVIGHITTSDEDARLVRIRNIHQDYFMYVMKGDKSSLTRFLFKNAMQYFQEHGRLMSVDGLEMKMKQDGYSGKRGELGERVVSLLVQCQALPLDYNSFPLLLEKLRDKMMEHLMFELGTKVRQTIKENGPTKAFDEACNYLMAKRVEYSDKAVPTTIFDISSGYQNIYDEYVERKAHPERAKGLEVGWKELDDATNGYKRQTFNLVIGEVNKGKSTMLLNMAIGMHKRGYNVLFFSFEMPMFQVKARYVASRLKLPYDGFVHGNLEESQELRLKNWFDDSNGTAQFRQFEKEAGAYFAIIDQPDDTSPSFIEQTVRQYRQYHGAPDAIFVDYLNNMKCDVSKVAQWWEHTGMAAQGLRRIARIYDLAAFSAQQINREGLKFARKKIEEDPLTVQIHPEHIEGWKDVINTCDSAIGFTPNIDHQEIYVYRIKGRDWFVENFTLGYIPEMSFIADIADRDADISRVAAAQNDMAPVFNDLRTLVGQREAGRDELDRANLDRDMFK